MKLRTRKVRMLIVCYTRKTAPRKAKSGSSIILYFGESGERLRGKKVERPEIEPMPTPPLLHLMGFHTWYAVYILDTLPSLSIFVRFQTNSWISDRALGLLSIKKADPPGLSHSARPADPVPRCWLPFVVGSPWRRRSRERKPSSAPVVFSLLLIPRMCVGADNAKSA